MKRAIFQAVVVLMCTLSQQASARQIFVDDSAAGANDGSNWTNAFNYLQDALEVDENGDEIRVAQGTYKPDQGDQVSTGDQDAAFNLIAGVTIKGGYAGFGAPDPDVRDCDGCRTILSGDLAGNDVEVALARNLTGEPTRAENSHNILYVGTYVIEPAPVIEGFTIKGASDKALNMNHSDIIVTDCVFQSNASQDFGGAVYSDNSRAVFTRCSFLNNTTGGTCGGGAVYSDGCGTCRSMYAAFIDCIFMGNHAGSYGGAVCSKSTTVTTAINCLFVGNTAGGSGAALYEDSYTYGNQLGSHLVNCTFAGNNCIAVYVTQYGYANLTSCILWNNLRGTAAGLGAQISCETPTKEPGPGSATVNYCCIEGWDGSLGGTGNFPDNPRFATPGVWETAFDYTPGDYHIESVSPCINAGDPSFIVAPTNPQIPSAYAFYNENMDEYILRTSEEDLDAELRMLDGRVDIGPYERHSTTSPIIYVDDSATGDNDGSSWTNAFNYLQDALEAVPNGYEIRVAQGTYRPDQGDEVSTGDREATFHMGGNLIIKGGYAGFGQPDPDARNFNIYETILTGDLTGNDAEITDARDLLTHATRADNSYHVVTVSGFHGEEVPTIEGFTITGGNAGEYGGGLYVDYDDAIVTDCTFANNSAGYGGGATAFRNGRTIFTRCSFINNAAAEKGGAVHQDGCSTCRSMYGAFIDCVFMSNYAGIDGGAMYNTSLTLTTCINSLFVGNKALNQGGALIDDAYVGTYLVNCTLSGNNFGAVHATEYGFTSLTNCILSNNLHGTYTGQNAQISWQQNTWGQDNTPVINYCCIEGWDGSLGGAGNFDANPQFLAPGSWDVELNYTPGNYHLEPDSPCINAGDPNYVAAPTGVEIPTGYYWPQEVDPDDYIAKSSETGLDALPRVVQGRVDMGPYEWHIAALIAHWKLDESEGDTAEDSAGDNDGTLHGGPLWLPNEGRLEGALLFDGDDDYVDCGDSSDFDITGQITVAAWVNISAVNMDWQTVVAKGDSAWRLSTAEDEYRYHFAVTGGPPWNYINGDIVVAANEWHHVCGTYDGADLRLYIDGAEDPAGPVPEAAGVTTNDFDVLIGENQERASRQWDGMIDDVRIYNYALNSVEVSQLVSPTVIYVDSDAPGLKNGCSWADAFNCLQDALALAAEGAEIRVAQGTYAPECGQGITPGDRHATFQLKNAVTILGGYAGYGQPNPDTRNTETFETILSGDLLANDLEVTDPCELPNESTRAENSYRVITGSGTDQTAVLDGFTITGAYSPSDGGGMYNTSGSPTVRNCKFVLNFAEDGAAIYNYDDSNPVLTNCQFTENAVYAEEGSYGGAVYNRNSNPTLTNCTFTSNFADVGIPDHGGGYGGAMYNSSSNPTLTDCTFSENTAGCNGGAVANEHNSNPILTNCTFTANTATGWGARWGNGGAIFNSSAGPTIADCTFTANSAAYAGGGVYNDDGSDPSLTDCTFTENSALIGAGMGNYSSSPALTDCSFNNNSSESTGGGLHCGYWCSATLVNCTFADNTSGSSGGGAYFGSKNHPTLTGCTITRNAAGWSGGGIGLDESAYPTLHNCTLAGNIAAHGGGAMSCDWDNLPILTNCLIVGNVAAEHGGGIYAWGDTTLSLTNCTLSDNSAGDLGGALCCEDNAGTTLSNCILSGNTAGQGSEIAVVREQVDRPSTVTVGYTNITAGHVGVFVDQDSRLNWDIGNIVIDPCFVERGYWDDNSTPGVEDDHWIDGDYHLKSFAWRWDAAREQWAFDRVTSRCIDAANPGSPLLDETLAVPDDPDNDYGQNLRINMGAYGGTAQASMPPYDWAILADLNNDGIADFYDLACAGPYWALTDPDQPCDLDRSGDTGPTDLDIFADDWLKTTIWHE